MKASGYEDELLCMHLDAPWYLGKLGPDIPGWLGVFAISLCSEKPF